MNKLTHDPKTQRRLTVVTALLVLVLGTVFGLMNDDQETVDYLALRKEGYMLLSDADGNVVKISYQDVISATYLETVDFGQPEGGTLTENVRLGQWRSPQLGLYWNCTMAQLDCCVLLETEDGLYAVSYESAATSRALAQAIVEARDTLRRQSQ